MLELLIDNIFVKIGGHIKKNIIDIPMRTNCAPLLVDLFLFSYEAEFIQNIVKDKLITKANAFNLTFRYIDDVQSLKIQALLIGFHIIKIPKRILDKISIKTASSAHFLTFTSHLTPMVNFLPDFITKETTSILLGTVVVVIAW